MKKILTLLTFISFACMSSLQAGAATTSQKWWGYMGDATGSNSIGLGQAADTYHCAIFIPGNHDVAGGKNICAVRFSINSQHVSDVKAWIATELPTATPSTSNTQWVADVASDAIGDNIIVNLERPYSIPASGVFVGYSFTITSASTEYDQYPVMTIGTDVPYALLMRTDNYIPQWGDFYGYNFGVLDLKVLLEGTFADYVLSPSTKQDGYYAQVGETVDVDLVLTNNGEANVSSFTYNINNGEEQTMTFGKAVLRPGKQGVVTINIPADNEAGSSQKTLTVTKVNGNDNESNNASTTFTVYTLDRLIQRNVVVEEFTGTGCGWCPRGLAGMDKLRKTFGDRFIGIGIHQYNSGDAMYIANYPYLDFGGAPSCRIDRGDVIDPYYGSNDDVCNDFLAEMNQPAMAYVDVCGYMDEGMTEVEAVAYIEPLFDSDNYSLEMALVADGLSGTTSAWWQTNYYSSQSASQQPEDLKVFCSGGKMGSSSIKGYVFNDVAVGTSYDKTGVNQIESLGTLAGGETREVAYTLSLPTKATLRNALKKGTIYVVALVVDNNSGRIVNAAKRLVGEDITNGVNMVQTSATGTAANYSLNGTKLAKPQRGINIVRQADGSVRKVIMK